MKSAAAAGRHSQTKLGEGGQTDDEGGRKNGSDSGVWVDVETIGGRMK